MALPAAVFILGLFSPPREGLTPAYLATFGGLLLALVLVDQTAPSTEARLGRRLLWLGAELGLAFLVVRVHGTLVRPALIYLLPASRALLLFGPRTGAPLSLSVWLAYGVNVGLYAWPDRLHEYPNYFSFFLAPYILAVVLTLVVLRQAADRRRLQGLYDELRQAHAELQALHRRAREAAVAEERNRLAREIHDSLAHYLTVINVQLEAAEKLARDRPDKADEQVRRARRLAVECLQETRRSVAALRAPTLDELALSPALEKLAAEFAENTGLQVALDVRLPDDLRLPTETAQALYRAVQEGLTNVQRHAQATTVQVLLHAEEGGLALTVQDDGVGPLDTPPDRHEGFGLLGLRERVELLGGMLRFDRGADGGGRLAIRLPVGQVP